MESITLHISGMSCGHCVARVQKALAGLDGVAVDSVAIGEATVRIDPTRRAVADLARAVEAAGYHLEAA
jgi:copper chaperone CopZ